MKLTTFRALCLASTMCTNLSAASAADALAVSATHAGAAAASMPDALSTMIRAHELKGYEKLHGKSPFLDIHHSGLIVQRSEADLHLIQINNEGPIETLAEIAAPIIEKKILFEANIISPVFVEVMFGEPSDGSVSPFHTETSDTNHSRDSYTNIERRIWDIVRREFFKIESTDFESVSLRIHNFNNPERMLAVESLYKVEGDNKYQNRYRYYNLLERSFYEQVVYDFDPLYTWFRTSTDESGEYQFKYAVESNTAASTLDIRRVNENADGTLSIGKTVFTTQNNHVMYEFNDDEDTVIFYRIGGGGFITPSIVNLTRKNPSEQPLLLEDEVDALRSNVYDASVHGGVLIYKTHYEKPEFHTRRLRGEISPKGRLLEQLVAFSKETGIDYTNPGKHKDVTLRIARDVFGKLRTILESVPGALKPWEEAMAHKFLSDNFISYALSTVESYLPADKLVPVNSAIIPTADTELTQPVYYTLPETKVNPTGWFIIDVHGGPHWREFNEIDMPQEFWTSRGFPHIRLNIRGSTGLGADYRKASDGHWYDVIEDVKAGIDWAKGQGFGEKVIITGGSFGGYAAAAAYAKGYADYAIAINGVYDLEKDLDGMKAGKTKYSKHNLTDWLTQFGNTPEIRARNSVTTHLTHRTGKMLILAGLKDDNCLPEQSELLFTEMQKRGNHAELVTMAEEGHCIQKLENLLMMYRVMETFVGDITGYTYEPSGYSTLLTTPGVVYKRTSERATPAAAPAAV